MLILEEGPWWSVKSHVREGGREEERDLERFGSGLGRFIDKSHMKPRWSVPGKITKGREKHTIN